MALWTKEKGLKELDRLIKEIEKLRGERRFSADHTRWVANTLAFLEEVFGRDSRYYLTLASLTWSATGSFVIDIHDILDYGGPQGAIEKKHHDGYLSELESARGLLQAASDHLKRVKDINSVYEGKDTGPESSAIVKIINIVERKLRKVIRRRPDQEKEVRDALEDLLIGAGISYSREMDRIVYSSKTYVPDFTIGKIDLAIDVKLCARENSEEVIIAEINDDIMAYQTKFGNLFFVVYDLGFIRDIDHFKDEFEKNENVVVTVVKH